MFQTIIVHFNEQKNSQMGIESRASTGEKQLL
jgi:hypothetical protein